MDKELIKDYLMKRGSEKRFLPDHCPRNDPHEWTNLISERPDAAKKLKPWLPRNYTDTRPSKAAYHFDQRAYSWTRKGNPN